MPFQQNFTVIDLETTGPISEQNHIIDIGILRVEKGRIVKTYQSLVRPPIPIPGSITRLTNIQDEDVKDAPTFKEVAQEVEALFENSIFTAHNAPFDYGFLSLEFMRLGRRFAKPVLCTKNLAHKALPELPKLGLDALMEHFKITATDRHRAFPDAEITAKVFLKLFEIEGIQNHLRSVLILESTGALEIPTSAFFEHLPQAPGVYRFLSERGEALYVGSSINVRVRAVIHFLAQIESKKEEELCHKTKRIEGSECPTELEALIEEAQEIRRLRPLYNRVLKRWYPGAYLWVTQEEFPQIFIEAEPPAEDAKAPIRSFGPYGSRRLLEKLVEFSKSEYHLCEFRVGRLKHPLRRYPGRRACSGLRAKQCLGACVGDVTAGDYQKHVEEALRMITYPLKHDEKEAQNFLKVIKSKRTDKLPGGWKLKRLLLRLLKDHEVLFSAGEAPYLIEETEEKNSFKTFFLIHEGLLQKVWCPEKEAPEKLFQEEIREFMKKPVVRKEDEGRIERLVIKHYLAEPRRERRIIHLEAIL